MSKIHTVAAVAAMVLVAGRGISEAAEASASVDVASAYVFRGTTFNDGLVVQPGLEVGGPITLGVWGNLDIDDYDGALSEGQFSEVDLHASYDLPMPEDSMVGVALGYCEYLYPGFGGAELGTDDAGAATAEATQGESDREVSVSVSLDVPLAPSLGAYYGVDGGIEKDLYLELGLSHEFTVSEDLAVEIGSTLGYIEPDEGDSGFSHYTASISMSYACFSAGVTYVGQIDDVLPNGPGAYDTDVYGTVGLAWDL